MKSDRHTLVVIPAYNAASYLPELLKRLASVHPLERCLVIDDGSSDNTAQILGDANVNFIHFRENRGKGAALRAGFGWARDNGFTSVVTIDADLQHCPEEIPALIEAHFATGSAVTIGSRFPGAPAMPWPRQISNCLTSLVLSLCARRRIRDCQCGFRALNLSHLPHRKLRESGFMFESELLFTLSATDAPIGEAPISAVYSAQRSYIHPLRDSARFLRLLWRRFWY